MKQKLWGHVGPLHKIQGYQGPELSSNADLITMGQMYNKGKLFENQFFIYGPKCKKKIYFGLFRGP